MRVGVERLHYHGDMLFLVDGYNVTMADPDTRELDKERMRSELVARLGVRGGGLLGTGRIIVVFDAREQYGLSTETIAGVSVVYARDADSEIVRRAAAANEQVVVVTNDMRLRARVSQDVARRVEYRDSSACFAAAAPSARPKARGGIARETGLPKGANEITEELKKLWLDEDG
ncbi:MAG TPA: NYN domain-containing protein [Coriobacteriia bacterium]|nr:NYN domain-containing protein [Coriobacteriia bacterium]